MKVVISQPMFFPWVGLFEQIRLADIYVHYDDVQFPRGRSFMSRVQIKTQSGVYWLSVPIQRKGLQLIKDVVTDDSKSWRETHLKTIKHNYIKAPFFEDMMEITQSVYSLKTNSLSEINIYATEKICQYFNIAPKFLKSSTYNLSTSGSDRILEIVKLLNGNIYITGHGARNYLDHELFEREGVTVEYMNYEKKAYPQLHGEFTPYVSILDLIANMGKSGIEVITSKTIHWKEFI